MSQDFADKALSDMNHLKRVVQHKTLFFLQKWSSYDTAKPGTLHLLSPETRISDLRKDYAAMAAMIFGEAPTWEDIIRELRALGRRINTR